MAVVVNITNPGQLVDAQLGVSGVGDLAAALGFGGALADQVDQKAADAIRGALADQGAQADVYVTSSPPDASSASSSSGLVVLAVAAVAMLLLAK